MLVVFTSVDPNNVKYYRDSLKGTGAEVRIFTKPLSDVPPPEIADAEVLSVFVYDRLNREVLEKLPRLKLLQTRSVGYDHIDLGYCREKGILVCHIPAYSPSAVAQHTFSLILSLVRKLKKITRRVSQMDYSQSYEIIGENLEDLTLGVVGTGRIGSLVAEYGLAFGMKVLAYDLIERRELKEKGVIYTSLEELLSSSDIVSLHVPYNPSTHHLINEERLSLMKRGAILVNTARGGVVDTQALYNYVLSGRVGGVALDVFEEEELLILKGYRKKKGSTGLLKLLELSHRDNVIITPHIAFFTKRAVENIKRETVRTIRAFLEGRREVLEEYLIRT
ncbi:MAG: lactate dehydrogenase [Aquificae bacterium]|nr:lactate dehydrogenase [Aquificota bacterium]